MRTPLLPVVALVLFGTSTNAASRIEGKRAARIYDSLIVPVTEITAHDRSYSVFVKEKDGVKCSALSKGEVRRPGRQAKYGCEFKVVATLQ